jgi:hypothetical protein
VDDTTVKPTAMRAAFERVLGENGLSPDAFGLVVTDEARTSAQEHSKTLAAAIGEYRARKPGATVHPLVCKLLGAGDDGVTWIPPGAPSSEPLALGYVPDEVVADALIQAGFSAICERDRFEKPMTYLRMSLRVARALQWECFAAAIRRSQGWYTKNGEAKARKLATYLVGISKHPAFARWYAEQEGVRPPDLNPRDAHVFGAWGMNMLARHLPAVFQWKRVRRPKKKGAPRPKKRRFQRRKKGRTRYNGPVFEYLLTLTPGASGLAAAVFEDGARHNRGIFPCVRPPPDWTSVRAGGVWTQEAMPQPLIRTPYIDVLNAAQKAIDTKKMRPVLDAVNAQQRVPLMINGPVLNFMLRVEQRPDKDASFEFDMAAATWAAARDRFWLGYWLDTRGRLYALSNFNYAREDHIRALFMFAEGKPIGERGTYWLKCHLAACAEGLGWGGCRPSKLGFDARVAWVHEHAQTLRWIGRTALGPEGPTLLAGYMEKLKKPYQFIAATIEFANVLDRGPGYESRLPVQFDQSSSGPQHLVLLTKDDKAAPLVSLTPGSPHDLYEEIAHRVREGVYADIGLLGSLKGRPYAAGVRPEKVKIQAGAVFDASMSGSRASLDFVNKLADAIDDKFARDLQAAWRLLDPDQPDLGRDIVKLGGGMTFFYNSATGGMAERILAKHPGLGHEAATYLAKRIYKITPEVLPGPARVLERLKALVGVFNGKKKTFRWYTRNGLPVLNLHLKSRTETVTTYRHVNGVAKPRQTEVAVEHKDEIDNDDAVDAVTANFIHSLDGCLLQRIAVRAEAAGIPLLTVHDCFAAPAADAEQLRDILFDELAKLYCGRDILAEVWVQARKDLPADAHKKLPKLPPYGNLVVESGHDIDGKAFA